MEFEEKMNEEKSAEQQSSSYQGYRPGRSPRPRIQKPRPSFGEQEGYNHSQSDDEGSFRPEGFGAGLQSGAPQRGGYRPRPNYNREGGYQPRQGGYGQRPQGYRPRPQYGEEGGYQPRQGG